MKSKLRKTVNYVGSVWQGICLSAFAFAVMAIQTVPAMAVPPSNADILAGLKVYTDEVNFNGYIEGFLYIVLGIVAAVLSFKFVMAVITWVTRRGAKA